jgi:serine phosphatase RsbU (regulator of sigma subunit)
LSAALGVALSSDSPPAAAKDKVHQRALRQSPSHTRHHLLVLRVKGHPDHPKKPHKPRPHAKKQQVSPTAEPTAEAASTTGAATGGAKTSPSSAPQAPAPQSTPLPKRHTGSSTPTKQTHRRLRRARRPQRAARAGQGRRSSPAIFRVAPLPLAATQPGSTRRARSKRASRKPAPRGPIARTVYDIEKVIPESIEVALAALAALAIMLGGGYLFTMLRARRLDGQRAELLDQVGLLQAALLPTVPRRLRSLRVSVAYRPADGPGAGGDFYDVLRLAEGRTGFIVGDISGHGRAALAHTAFLRYTLGAYLEAGLEPNAVLQVAQRVLGDKLGSDFATVLAAVHDPDTGSLTYACAGHPPPIVVGPSEWTPITQVASPPLGLGLRTGLRQTTVPLPPDSFACMFTDGLPEARTQRVILGRGRLGDILAELGREASAEELIERVASEARAVRDDMAACLIAPTAGATVGSFRTEQLELNVTELQSGLARRFLAACGVDEECAAEADREAHVTAERFGGAVLQVTFGNRLRVEVLPVNVASIELAHAH